MGVNAARRARKARPPSNCRGNAIRDPHAARAKRVLFHPNPRKPLQSPHAAHAKPSSRAPRHFHEFLPTRRAREARPASRNCGAGDATVCRAARSASATILARIANNTAARAKYDRQPRSRHFGDYETLPRARSTTSLYQEIAGTEGQHCSAHAGASGKRPKHGGACRRCTPRPQSVSCITEIAAQDATAGRAGRGALPSPRTVRKVLWDDSLHFLFGAPSPAGFAITAATRTRRAGRVGMRLP